VPQDRATITPKEAAAYLEISEDTVVRWFTLVVHHCDFDGRQHQLQPTTAATTIHHLYGGRPLGVIAGYRKTPSARGRIRLYRDSVEQFDRQRKSQAPPRKL
jgi:hypothetical protein